MELFYRLAADAVVVTHLAYVLFVIFGLLLTIAGGILKWKWVRNPWFRFIHLTMILIVVFEVWMGITCPLTTWEKNLRSMAGDASYQGDFLPNLMHDLLFFENVPNWVFATCYSAFGAAILLTFVFIPPRIRRDRDTASSIEGSQESLSESNDEFTASNS